MYYPYSASSRRVLAVALLCCVAAPATAAVATDLDQLVVTASRTAQTQDQALAPIAVIDRAQIERRQVNSLPELLRGEAGVQLVNNGGPGKATSLFLRGTESDHVLVLVDGVKIGSATSGGAALQDIPLEQIERIEIVRGPFSSLYGSEAIGGVIQIFTRRPQGAFTPSFSAAVGSDTLRRYSAGVSGRSQGDLAQSGGWYAINTAYERSDGINAYLKRSASYYDPDLDGYSNRSLSAKGGWRFSPQWAMEAHALQANSRNEYDGSTSNIGKGEQQAAGGKLIYSPADAFKLTATVGYSADLSDTYLDDVYSSTFNTRRKQAALQADLQAGPGLLTLGGDWLRDDVQSSEVYDVDHRRNHALFAQWQQSFGAQSLQVSVRRDDDSQFDGKTTGSVLWGWNFSDQLRLTASYGTAYKAPTFNELYYPNYGNPNLAPESSRSFELGLRGEHDWGDWSLNAFQTQVDDLIAYDSSLVDANHPYGQPNNVDEARIRGVEAVVGTELAGWMLRSTLTWQDPRADGDTNHGNLLARRARQSGRIDVDRKFGRLRIGSSLFASGYRYDELRNSTRLPGYALLDLRVGVTLVGGWDLGLSANNVFDRDYQTAAWYAQPGRNYLLTLRYHPQQ
jgi:vitamin B12 transporter